MKRSDFFSVLTLLFVAGVTILLMGHRMTSAKAAQAAMPTGPVLVGMLRQQAQKTLPLVLKGKVEEARRLLPGGQKSQAGSPGMARFCVVKQNGKIVGQGAIWQSPQVNQVFIQVFGDRHGPVIEYTDLSQLPADLKIAG